MSIFVGIYGQFYYQKTLEETEYLVALMLFATGLQNGLPQVFPTSRKNNPPYRNNNRLWNLIYVYPEKIQKEPELIGRAKY
jgi:hypothetical protein